MAVRVVSSPFCVFLRPGLLICLLLPFSFFHFFFFFFFWGGGGGGVGGSDGDGSDLIFTIYKRVITFRSRNRTEEEEEGEEKNKKKLELSDSSQLILRALPYCFYCRQSNS